MRIAAQIQEFRSRSPKSVQTAIRKRRKLSVHADEPLGMRVRERMEENGVDHSKYPGGGSNPEHQAEYGRGGETRILAHHPDCKLEVLPERFHETPSSAKGTFETRCMFPATENSRRSGQARVSRLSFVMYCKKRRSEEHTSELQSQFHL